MLNTNCVVLLSSNIELELAKLLIACFLEGTELEDELFIALGLVTKVGFKLGDTPLLFILSLCKVIDFTFI